MGIIGNNPLLDIKRAYCPLFAGMQLIIAKVIKLVKLHFSFPVNWTSPAHSADQLRYKLCSNPCDADNAALVAQRMVNDDNVFCFLARA